MQNFTDVMKVTHRNELNFKIKALKDKFINQGTRKKNEEKERGKGTKNCAKPLMSMKSWELGVEVRYLGIYLCGLAM